MMGWDPNLLAGLFLHYVELWWVIIPAIMLGVVVGALPGFNAQNTLIIILPLPLILKQRGCRPPTLARLGGEFRTRRSRSRRRR